MYVKIMTREQKTYREDMFECTNFKYNEENGETLFHIIHAEDNVTTFSLDKTMTDIYVMNNNGVTIDSYKWTEDGRLK